MYIARVPNRGSPPAILLRESYRQGGKVNSRTLANLSKLPPQAIDAVSRTLKGETLVPVDQAFDIVASHHHGHVEAVLTVIRRLGLPELIASRRSGERDLVVAMVASRIIEPCSKLAMQRTLQVTTLPSLLNTAEANEDDLYEAMDWLLERQGRIESKLAARHLHNDGLALYDLTSSYFEGVTCPLAARGHNRDGKKGKLQVNYGLLTNQLGIPVSVSVFEGNTGDPTTLLAQVTKAREDFGISRFAIVGDRGMITQKQINTLRDMDGIDWITALRPEAIKKLVEAGVIQMSLFDEHNLFELTHPDFPGERLVACRNPELAKRRAGKRKSLLEATATELERVRRMVARGRLHNKDQIRKRVQSTLKKYKIGKHYKLDIRDDGFDFQADQAKITAEAEQKAGDNPERVQKRLNQCKRHMGAITKQLQGVRQRIQRGQLHGKDKIGVRVGKVLNKYHVGKHFKLDIDDDRFDFEVDQNKVRAEAALDGIYVIRTGLSQDKLNAANAVRSYKLLSQVERAFRSFKTIDLEVRPIRHRLEDRVRAHIFLCMLAYYILWHMLEAWRPLLFADEDLEAKKTRDPVAPARRSEQALHKVHTRTLEDGSDVHSFQSLLKLLSGIVRNTCSIPGAKPDTPTFEVTTTPNAEQQRALDLLRSIRA